MLQAGHRGTGPLRGLGRRECSSLQRVFGLTERSTVTHRTLFLEQEAKLCAGLY
jgi:hypothetical protein